ncbi:MAG: YitT family protein [Clostridiaceae bacterium]|nr:YitT family protein [Clostridiaceae bacterium]
MKKGLFDYLHIIIGSLILALGINVFLAPNKISTGGVGGLATIFLYVFRIPMSLSTLVLNLILFVIGYKTLPKSSIVKTLVGIVFLSVFLQLTSYISYYCDDMMISAIFGGTLVGVGVGLVVLKDASTGGSDFAAIILNKAIPYISLATFILIIDALIILTSGMVFRDYTIMFYSVLSLYVSTKVTDMIMVRGDYAKSVFIISEKSNVIAKEILDTIERGVTGIYSKGLYHGKDGLMLLCIVKSKELHILMNIVKKIDKEAFVIISEARKILGEGFKEQ